MRPVGVGHMKTADLLDARDRCTICGHSGERSRELLLQRDPDVWLLHCPACHASSADHLPRQEALTALYAPDVYVPNLNLAGLPARHARHVASKLSFDPDASVALLDYGGNDGAPARALITALRDRGHRGELSATVVDLYPREPEENLRFVHVDDFARATDRYDFLMASAVVEHLPDMGDVTRRILAAGKPGALFWARTPYDVPLARLGLGFPVLWPRHMHDFGPAFWARFTETFGVRGRLLRSAPSPAQSSLRSEPLRALLANALKLPAQLERAWLRAPESPGLAWRFVGGWEALVRLDPTASS